MAPSFLSYIVWFLALIAAQVAVCNHIHLFGYAMPMVYIYFIMLLPGNMSRWSVLLLAFVLGLVIDMFSGTPGMASSSLLRHSA